MNKVEIEGGLTSELDPRFSPDGSTAFVNFTLAVPGVRWDPGARREVIDTTYVRCEAVGHQAEALIEIDPSKGTRILVLGELTQYERKDGDEVVRKTRVSVKTFSITRLLRGE